jgi:hypothetical protein
LIPFSKKEIKSEKRERESRDVSSFLSPGEERQKSNQERKRGEETRIESSVVPHTLH